MSVSTRLTERVARAALIPANCQGEDGRENCDMSASILAAAIQVNKTEAWVTIGLFFVLWVVVGAVLKRFVITEEDQLLAGRNVGDALGIMTVMAAWITTGTILG